MWSIRQQRFIRLVDRASLQSFADGPAGQILQLAKLLAPLGPGLVVNDDALADCAVRPREDEWACFIDACNVLRAVHTESA